MNNRIILGDIILGIETSCDETAAAVVLSGRKVLSNVIASQVDTHREYGGVVPEIAARKHMESISYIVEEALRQAGLSLADIRGVAVSNGPGLVGALLVGLSFAKALAFARQVPLLGVHHIYSHICANYLHAPSSAKCLGAPFYMSGCIRGAYPSDRGKGLLQLPGVGPYQR
jgi:N6-L-threonylcarbamoyladenine synthase